jgi:hypothetical protein
MSAASITSYGGQQFSFALDRKLVSKSPDHVGLLASSASRLGPLRLQDVNACIIAERG